MTERNILLKTVLDSYFNKETDLGRFNSQDVCDNLCDIMEMTPDEVTAYMIENGWSLTRQVNTLVWTRA